MNTLIQQLHRLATSKQVMAYLQADQRTYADFYQAVGQTAQQLAQQSESTWALWCEDSYDFAVHFFALLLAGKTVILPPNRLDSTVTQLAEEGIAYFDGMTVLTPDASAPLTWPNIAWQQAQVVFYTSGSTGTPKKIHRTMGQLMCEIDVLHTLFPWTDKAVVFATVSHQHLFGLCYKILLPLQQGCAFVNEQCLYPEDLEQAYASLNPTDAVLVSSPAFLSRWQEPQAACKYLQIFSSGGPLPAQVPEQLQHDIVEIFGSSESGGIAWRHAPQAWQVFPNVRIRIDASEQLWIQTEHAYTADWISTGDAARALQDGHSFELLGRLDRMIKLEEKRLSLDAIEKVLLQQTALTDVHVCVIPHKDTQQLAAVCALSADAWTQLREQGKHGFVQSLKRCLQGQLESIAIPKRWRFIQALPRNSQSKLNHAAMLALFSLQKRPVSQVLQKNPDSAEILLWFPPELQGFQGHFPGFAIYPGVAQLDMVQHHIRSLFLPEHVCVGVEQLKFQQPIRPYDEAVLQLQCSDLKVLFKLMRGNTSLASGRLYFEAATGV